VPIRVVLRVVLLRAVSLADYRAQWTTKKF